MHMCCDKFACVAKFHDWSFVNVCCCSMSSNTAPASRYRIQWRALQLLHPHQHLPHPAVMSSSLPTDSPCKIFTGLIMCVREEESLLFLLSFFLLSLWVYAMGVRDMTHSQGHDSLICDTTHPHSSMDECGWVMSHMSESCPYECVKSRTLEPFHVRMHQAKWLTCSRKSNWCAVLSSTT